MPEPTKPAKVRGVFEKPPGSEIWWIQYFDHGQRRRERVGTRANAIRLYQKRRTQILTGDKLPELQRRRVTLGELIEDALDYAREHHLVMRNYIGYAAALGDALGARAAEDIKPAELGLWIRRKGSSPANFNRHRAFASLCYREGIRAGKVRDNPARQVQMRREPRGRQRFLSREEYDKVLARLNAIDTPEKPLIVLAFVLSVYTGMRLSEQFGLLWRDIDFERGVIRLRKTKNGDDREIPMASVVVEHLLPLRPASPGSAKPLVFVRPRGGKGRIRAPQWFAAVIAELGIENYTWHNNRHTFCSWLAMAAVSLRTIQELAGHRTVEMSARYSHLSPDHKRAEVEKLVAPPAPARVLEFGRATRSATG